MDRRVFLFSGRIIIILRFKNMRPAFKDQLSSIDSSMDFGKSTESDLLKKLQIEKRHLENRLKETYALMERGEVFVPEAEYLVEVGFVDGVFFEVVGEKKTIISRGQILTGIEWGIGYVLDPVSVPLELRKEYAASITKRKILELLNKQIIHAEKEQSETFGKSFLAVEKRLENARSEIDWDIGHLAERLVLSYLRRLSLDGILPIEVEEVDVFEDVVDKIDLVIDINGMDQKHGYEVETGSARLGIQVTLKNTKDQVLKKRDIVNEVFLSRGFLGDIKIDDIRVLYLNEKYIDKALKKWRRKKDTNGRRVPFAPDFYLEEGGQKELLHRLFDDLLGVESVMLIGKKLGFKKDNVPITDWSK